MVWNVKLGFELAPTEDEKQKQKQNKHNNKQQQRTEEWKTKWKGNGKVERKSVVRKYKVVSVRISNQQQSNTTKRQNLFIKKIFTWSTHNFAQQSEQQLC